MAMKENTPKEIMSPLDVFDLTSDLGLAEQIMKSEKAQGLYGYYFETSREVISLGDETAAEIWKNEVKNLLKMIESIPVKPLVEGESDSRTKLIQNFKDLVDALESNNREYFGATQATL